jgi:NADH-quinone oxidoreductase subunit H
MEGFFSTPAGILAVTLAQTLALLVPLLIGVAYLTYAERKVLAAMQLRKGPNVVGPVWPLPALRGRAEAADEGDGRALGANRLLFLLAPISPSCSPCWPGR